MFRFIQVFLIVLAACGCAGRNTPTAKPQHWAVLIAGSNGWWNYRHQSDVLHAYKVLTAKGVKPENIVVMVYDDIAHAKYNPFPGKVFNKPNGTDVYEGVPLDYTGDDVNADVFLAVLSGNKSDVKKTGSGKVIKSGPGDKVFVYYSDHGASGLICMPSGNDLYADQLHKVLKQHYKGGARGELVFYLEACESGSMFDGLTDGIDIFATTAANPFESSWAFYCPGDDVSSAFGPNDPTPDTIGACLGDEYSVHWLEDAESSDLTIETLKQQYKKVKQLTRESHVMQYGKRTIQVEDASNFIGITDLEPPSQAEGPEDVSDDEDDDDEVSLPAAQKSHRKMLEEEEEEEENEDSELVVDADHDSESESERESEEEHTHSRQKGDEREGDEEYEQGASRAKAGAVQRVPQRDAELAGMYATLKRQGLAAELRRELEDELINTIESRRQVDEYAERSAQRLVLASNSPLVSFLSQYMTEEAVEEDVERSSMSMNLMYTGPVMRLQAFTRQALYGANGRPTAGKPLVDDWDCLRAMAQTWKDATKIWDNAAKRHTRYFANLCNAGVTPQDFAHALMHQPRSVASSHSKVVS